MGKLAHVMCSVHVVVYTGACCIVTGQCAVVLYCDGPVCSGVACNVQCTCSSVRWCMLYCDGPVCSGVACVIDDISVLQNHSLQEGARWW